MHLLTILQKQRAVRLETRKRDGSWVATPVSVAVDGEHAYFRTWDVSGKARRLRNFPEVRVAPSTLTGKPTGPPAAACFCRSSRPTRRTSTTW